MKITVRTFSKIKEICGFEEREFIVSEGISISNVMKELHKCYKGLNSYQDEFLFAINENYCDMNSQLNENDILAIFPPVSGG